ALDLYDGLSENAANPIVNNSSSVKFIDLETWYYKTQCLQLLSLTSYKQIAKKQREKSVQPIRIVNKQQKYAEKRRKHYQIKSQQKQEKGEFRNLKQRLEQEFSMEMMEQEQLKARFQRFESGLLPQERDILIRNRLELQRMNQQYSDIDIQEFAYDNQQFILLTESARYNLLSQVIEDKRAHYAGEAIIFIDATETSFPTVEFFNNQINSPEDCYAFIERVYQHENGRLFMCAFDFGTAIQRSKYMIDPNTVGRDLNEVLYPGRIRYKPYKTTVLSKYRSLDEENYSKEITYRIQLPDENNTQNHAPIILYNNKSISEFKKYVRSTIMRMQERTQMTDTKDLMVAIFSMQIISYRLPFPGKNTQELIKIHKNKKNIIKYIHCDDDYNTCFWYNLTCITIPDSYHIEIDRYSRIAEGKRLQFEFYNVKKENQREFLKNYPRFNWDYSLKVTKDYNMLLLNDDDGNQHLMYIINVEKLLELQKVSGRNYPTLIPTAVASTIKAKNYIKIISYDKSEDNFVEKWPGHVFSETIQIRNDNKFSDEVPQRYEVPIIGFDFYDSLRNDMVGGNSFVIHRENSTGLTKIHKFRKQDQQISENCFKVELEKKRYQCSTPLQVAYFTMDNSKCFYLNAYYNFLTHCLYMDYIQVIYRDNDSLCSAIAHESWPVKDKKLWDQLYPDFFPSMKDYFDIKMILGWNIESEATTCLALAPKQHFKKLHSKSPDKIQDIPLDYQIKPLSKLIRPYFSPRLGSWEIDLVFSMDEQVMVRRDLMDVY
ncbi:MAG: hypothetical protein EZS28_020254, partial [Streblomastix strix]